MIFDGFVHQLPDIDPDETAGVARLARRGGRHARQDPGPVPAVQAARAGPRAARSASRPRSRTPYVNTIPPRAGAVVPRRRAHRAPHPRLHPLERGGDGGQGQQARRRHRRPPLDVRLLGRALRGRLQPLLPRQGRRPAPATTSTSRATPRPASTPGRSSRAASPRTHLDHFRREIGGGGLSSLPAPAADARLLGVPDGVDGPRPAHARSTRPASTATCTTARSTTPARVAGVVLRRRRRVRRARDARRDLAGRPRAARQPDLRRQLQPAAPRRPGARQRQDHPGARGGVPRRRLERHQGHLGLEVGRAAGPATSTACCSTR